MCWTGKRFFERMPRIALRDIEVYKVLTKEGKSPYQDYQYDFNKETKQVYLKTLKRVNGAIDIYEGYHSYSKKCRFVKSFYDNSSVNYSNLLQFTFLSCLNLRKLRLVIHSWAVRKRLFGRTQPYYPFSLLQYVQRSVVVTVY